MWHFSSDDTKNISMIENPTPLTFKKRSITKIHTGDKEGKGWEGKRGWKRQKNWAPGTKHSEGVTHDTFVLVFHLSNERVLQIISRNLTCSNMSSCETRWTSYIKLIFCHSEENKHPVAIGFLK